MAVDAKNKKLINLEQEFWAKGSFTNEASRNLSGLAHSGAELEIVLVNNNSYDPNAISLRINNRHIGWVPMSKTDKFRRMFSYGYGAIAHIDRLSNNGEMANVVWTFAENIPIGKQYVAPKGIWNKFLNILGV